MVENLVVVSVEQTAAWSAGTRAVCLVAMLVLRLAEMTVAEMVGPKVAMMDEDWAVQWVH